jgi:hypothetical protein
MHTLNQIYFGIIVEFNTIMVAVAVILRTNIIDFYYRRNRSIIDFIYFILSFINAISTFLFTPMTYRLFHFFCKHVSSSK